MSDIRVTGTGKGEQTTTQSWYKEYKALRLARLAPPTAAKTTDIYFEESSSFVESPLYTLQDLRPGTVIHGPAIILDATQTIVVFPSNEATVLSEHVFIDVGLGPKKALDTGVVDPIALSIFGNRSASKLSRFDAADLQVHGYRRADGAGAAEVCDLAADQGTARLLLRDLLGGLRPGRQCSAW